MKITIGKRIIAGFALTVTLTAALGTFSYRRLVAIERDTAALATRALPGVYSSEEIKSRAETEASEE